MEFARYWCDMPYLHQIGDIQSRDQTGFATIKKRRCLIAASAYYPECTGCLNMVQPIHFRCGIWHEICYHFAGVPGALGLAVRWINMAWA
jgi:hypothetical protein